MQGTFAMEVPGGQQLQLPWRAPHARLGRLANLGVRFWLVGSNVAPEPEAPICRGDGLGGICLRFRWGLGSWLCSTCRVTRIAAHVLDAAGKHPGFVQHLGQPGQIQLTACKSYNPHRVNSRGIQRVCTCTSLMRRCAPRRSLYCPYHHKACHLLHSPTAHAVSSAIS